MGVDVVLGQAGDMSKLGIYESFRVGSSLVLAASQGPWCCIRVYFNAQLPQTNIHSEGSQITPGLQAVCYLQPGSVCGAQQA